MSVRVRPPAPTSKSSLARGCFSFAHTSAHKAQNGWAKEKKTVRSTAAFASAERGRMHCVLRLHERGHKKKPNCAIGARCFCECRTGRTRCVLHRITHTSAHKAQNEWAKEKRQCAAQLLLRVPNGGARVVCSTCTSADIRKSQTAPSAQGVSASAERGRTRSARPTGTGFRNNTNQDSKPRFVLFFARDYFGIIVRLQ